MPSPSARPHLSFPALRHNTKPRAVAPGVLPHAGRITKSGVTDGGTSELNGAKSAFVVCSLCRPDAVSVQTEAVTKNGDRAGC